MSSLNNRLNELESLRGFAAFYVLLTHINIFANTKLEWLARFGQEAVMLFFVLSGFVIHFSTFAKTSHISFGKYFARRFRRIYPIFLISLLISYVQQAIETRHFSNSSWWELFGNIIMLQDNAFLKPGVWFDTFCKNLPLWSLSYEWWFYMAYFVIMIVFRKHVPNQRFVVFTVSIVGILIYISVPNQICLIAGYFYLWWAGVELCNEYVATGNVTWKRQLVNFSLLAMVGIFWSIPVWISIRNGESLLPGVSPILQLRHCLATLALLAFGMLWRQFGLRGFSTIFGLFERLAPISFSVYLLHLPIKRIVEISLSDVTVYVVFCVTLIVVIPLCYLLEVKLQKRINGLFDKYFE